MKRSPSNAEIETVKLLLVEEPDENRKVLRAVLAAETTFDLVGEACSAEEALDLIALLRPEVVLIAPDLPDMSGAAATAMVLRAFPGTQVIALDVRSDPDAVTEMLAAGACALLPLRLRSSVADRAPRSSAGAI